MRRSLSRTEYGLLGMSQFLIILSSTGFLRILKSKSEEVRQICSISFLDTASLLNESDDCFLQDVNSRLRLNGTTNKCFGQQLTGLFESGRYDIISNLTSLTLTKQHHPSNSNNSMIIRYSRNNSAISHCPGVDRARSQCFRHYNCNYIIQTFCVSFKFKNIMIRNSECFISQCSSIVVF